MRCLETMMLKLETNRLIVCAKTIFFGSIRCVLTGSCYHLYLNPKYECLSLSLPRPLSVSLSLSDTHSLFITYLLSIYVSPSASWSNKSLHQLLTPLLNLVCHSLSLLPAPTTLSFPNYRRKNTNNPVSLPLLAGMLTYRPML